MIYEYEFGVFVEAKDEQEAWAQVREISEALDKIDVEGDSSVEGPFPCTPDMLPKQHVGGGPKKAR